MMLNLKQSSTLFSLLLLCGLKGHAQSSFCEVDSFWTKQKKFIYGFQKQELLNNLSQDCQRMLDYDTRFAAQEFQRFSNLPSDLREHFGATTTPWEIAMVPQEPPRQFVFEEMWGIRAWDLHDKNEVKDFLNGKRSVLPLDSAEKSRSPRTRVFESPHGFTTGTKIGTFLVLNTSIGEAICAELNRQKAAACNEGLSKIIDLMRFDYVSLPSVIDESLTDKKYETGIVIAAKKIISKAESKNPGPSHLYDDLYQSFKEAGATDKEAQKKTWDTLGILSTAGPDLGDRMSLLRESAYSDKSMVSLIAITSATPLLDYKSRQQNGETYSYPKGMKFACDNAKPYHFWMTAYFASRLINAGMDPEAAAMAAYTAEKGYQMMAKHGLRSNSTVEDFPPFHDSNNNIRKDLAQAASGAFFGATGKAPNIDEGMRVLVKAAVPGDTNTTVDLGHSPWFLPPRILKFNEVIAPNSVFKYFDATIQN